MSGHRRAQWWYLYTNRSGAVASRTSLLVLSSNKSFIINQGGGGWIQLFVRKLSTLNLESNDKKESLDGGAFTFREPLIWWNRLFFLWVL